MESASMVVVQFSMIYCLLGILLMGWQPAGTDLIGCVHNQQVLAVEQAQQGSIV